MRLPIFCDMNVNSGFLKAFPADAKAPEKRAHASELLV
jgi:hypothetical protein